MAAPSITSSAHLTVWVSFQTASGKNRAQIKEKCRISPGFHQDRRPNRGYVCLASMREPAEHVPQSLSYPNEQHTGDAGQEPLGSNIYCLRQSAAPKSSRDNSAIQTPDP